MIVFHLMDLVVVIKDTKKILNIAIVKIVKVKVVKTRIILILMIVGVEEEINKNQEKGNTEEAMIIQLMRAPLLKIYNKEKVEINLNLTKVSI